MNNEGPDKPVYLQKLKLLLAYQSIIILPSISESESGQ